MSDVIATVITAAGPQPQPPADLRAQLVSLAVAADPGLTTDLPLSLIEDIASTDVGALTVCESARVGAINAMTPFAANAYTLNQLGQIYGVPLGLGFTTSVLVVFTGPAQFVIAKGFTVSDGTFQYVAQEGGVIGSGNTSLPIFCLATIQGSWVVPENTVNQLITSVPQEILDGSPPLTATNPQAGTPGTGPQTQEDYRAQVLQAGQAISQGMATALRTELDKVPGVQPRLVAIRQVSGGWEIIVGGGDPILVAYAIYRGLFDISTLVGSTLFITGATKANPGIITTNLNHGYVSGQVVKIEDVVGMTELNGNTYTIAVVDEKSFSIGVDTTGFTTYSSGGVVTPNLRNEMVTITDYPDVYTIVYVTPPQQVVTLTVTWNTTETNFVAAQAVKQLGAPALVKYINSIYAGQPINLFELQNVFQDAISSVIPTPLLTRMVFAVSINGVPTAVVSGTGIIAGDPESYFETDPSGTGITINQG